MKSQHPLVATLLLSAVFLDAGATENLAEKYFIAVRSQLDPRAQAALEGMDGLGRQLLAARGYVRAGSGLDQRWSWTQQQIDAYQGSPAQIARDADISRVRAIFEMNNPGYSLFVQPEARGLDAQLQRWNVNDSITRAGDQMAAQLETAVHEPGFPPPATTAGTARFRELISRHSPQPVPALAAPGLSAHGRMNAVDFQVRQGNSIVAGADSTTVESVWIAHGWRDRLHTAVINASNRFKGPLAIPLEPWHYDYLP